MCTEPKCCNNCFLRFGPIPSIESRTDAVNCFERTERWYVITNLCASSRTARNSKNKGLSFGNELLTLPSGIIKCSSPFLTSPLVTPRIGILPFATWLAIFHCAGPPSTIIKSSFGPSSIARWTNSCIIAISFPARFISFNLKCLYDDFIKPSWPNAIIAPTGCFPNKCELSNTPAQSIFTPNQFSKSDTFLSHCKFGVYDGFCRIPRFVVDVNALILSRIIAAFSKSILSEKFFICFVKSEIIGSLSPVKILRASWTFLS